jgi:tripartite motif-containing protein 71
MATLPSIPALPPPALTITTTPPHHGDVIATTITTPNFMPTPPIEVVSPRPQSSLPQSPSPQHSTPSLSIATSSPPPSPIPPSTVPTPNGVKTCMGQFALDIGTSGNGDGQFNEPQGIAIDTATGRVYVADTKNDRVQCMSTRGHFLSILGRPSLHEDPRTSYEFKQPNSVGVDGSGDVYISDCGHSTVVAFGADSRPRIVGTSLLQGGRLSTPRISVNPQVKGHFYVSEPGSDRGYILGYRDGVQHRSSHDTGSRRSSPLRSSRASGSAAIQPPLLHAHKQHRRERSSGRGSGEYSFSLGTDMSPDQSMRQPQQSVVDHRNSLLYVCDAGNKRIQVYSLSSPSSRSGSGTPTPPRTPPRSPHSTTRSSLTGSPTPSPSSRNPSSISSSSPPSSTSPYPAIRRFGTGLLQYPSGIALGPEGFLYVSDRDLNTILVFTPDGSLVRSFGEGGDGQGQLRAPSSMAFDSRARLFVCNTGNSRITVFE